MFNQGTALSMEDAVRLINAFNNLAEKTSSGAFEIDFTRSKNSAQRMTHEIYKLLGLKTQNFEYWFPLSFNPWNEDSKPIIREALLTTKNRGIPYCLELQVTTNKGRKFWIHTTGIPIIENGTVVRILGTIQDITVRKELEEKLREEGLTDGLTEIPNRRHFLGQYPVEVIRAKRLGVPLSIMIIDLDNFKKVNDTYGHPYGDDVLKELGQFLGTSRRATDLVNRYGGEEFTIILPSTDLTATCKIAQQLVEKFRKIKFITPDGEDLYLTISVGATELLLTETSDDLLKRADANLYIAKNSGRNCVVCS